MYVGIENQGGSVYETEVALVSNTGESTKEARRLFGTYIILGVFYGVFYGFFHIHLFGVLGVIRGDPCTILGRLCSSEHGFHQFIVLII